LSFFFSISFQPTKNKHTLDRRSTSYCQ